MSAVAVPAAHAAAGTRAGARRLAAHVLMLASGFAGLGYQIVWTRQAALWLGHEAAAVLAVVAAFFGGLALGAFVLGGPIARSPRPGRWYAGCELVVGAWGAVLALALAPFSGWLLALAGPAPTPAWQWTVAFCGTFAVLLPATAAMGATLPALARVTAALPGDRGSIGALYASNTAGAVAGVLATAFWLIPALGLARTAAVCIGSNLACAIAAWALRTAPLPPAAPARPARAALARLAATGLLGIGYEVLVVRVLSQVTEDTVYTFALLLAVYLAGSALGAAWLQRRRHWTRDRLLAALAAACLAGCAALWGAERAKALLLDGLGGGMGAALAAEAALALLAFGPATAVMGALFSRLVDDACAGGAGLGRCLGANMLGGALAPLLFGVLLVPALGPKGALLLVAAGYLALTARPGWLRPAVALPAAALAALALWAPPLAFVDVPEGGRIVEVRDGVAATVSVVEDDAGVARLRIDNRQQEGSSATLLVDARQALLPLLLHPAPRRALFLGLGTGTTAAAAALDPALDVDAVELLPEVIAVAPHFLRRLPDGAARLHIVGADARRYVRTSERRYDVVVADNVHPARAGTGALYTVEHYAAVRDRLAADGLFCQWLPLHQLDLGTLRSIVGAFVAVFPDGAALLASNSLETPVLGLVARAAGGRYDAVSLRRRLDAAGALPLTPAALGLDDELSLFGSFVADGPALAAFAAGARANTDDLPVVAYAAPRATYAPAEPPAERLVALLHALSIAPDGIVAPPPEPRWMQRLSAYRSARDRYLEAGRTVQPSADVRRMLAQVREPLLAVLRTSPDFRPAYDPLLRMAGALAATDVPAARALLAELARLQPARAEAAQALRALDTTH